MGSSSLNKKLIFDEVRRAWVRATPEEMVRQQWIKRMIHQLGYPAELLVVEKAIKELPHLYQTRMKSPLLNASKPRGSIDCKSVHISNIDRLAIVEPRELSRSSKAGVSPEFGITSSEVPNRRLDILCYGKGSDPSCSLFPLLLVECKDERLTEGAVNQVIGYNHHVKAPFAAAVNLEEVRLGYFDGTKNQYIFCSFLPSFKELMQWVKR